MTELGSESVVKVNLIKLPNCTNGIRYLFWLPGIDAPSKGSYTTNSKTGSTFNPCNKSLNIYKASFRKLIKSYRSEDKGYISRLTSEAISHMTSDTDFSDDVRYYSVAIAVAKSRPKSHYSSKGVLLSKFKDRRPVSKPDSDKTERAVWDILTDEGIIIDDARIVNNTALKVWVGENYKDYRFLDKGVLCIVRALGIRVQRI